MKKLLIAVFVLSLVTACKKEAGKPVPNEIDSIAQNKTDTAGTVQTHADKEAALKGSVFQCMLLLI